MTYLLDTNVFIRFLVSDHAAMHKECVGLFSSVERGEVGVVTLSCVYAELVWTLQSFYQLERASIAEDLETFLSHGIEVDDSIDVSYATSLYRDSHKKFIDCLIASHRDLRSGAGAIISYDRDFDALGVKRLEPKEVIMKF